MNVSCPHCKKMLGIPDTVAPGQRLQCPQCKQQFQTPARVGGTSPAPPPPIVPAPVNPGPSGVSPLISPGPPSTNPIQPAASSRPTPPPPSTLPDPIQPVAGPRPVAAPVPWMTPIEPPASPVHTEPHPAPGSPPPGPRASRGRVWTIEFSPKLLQKLVAGGASSAMAVLLFFPWTRVLVPARLTPEQPAVVLKNLALVLDCSASMKERLVGGDIKIQTALKSAGELIDKLPADMRLTCVLSRAAWTAMRAGKAQVLRKLMRCIDRPGRS